jgi:hypothetical protein
MADMEWTKERHEAAVAREKVATKGPWVHRRDGGGRGVSEDDRDGSDRFIVEEGANGCPVDMDFIVGARNDMADMLAEIGRLQAIAAAWEAHSRAGQRMWTAQQAHDLAGCRKAVEDIENASEDLRVLGVDPEAADDNAAPAVTP